jgi:hypothetical protein
MLRQESKSELPNAVHVDSKIVLDIKRKRRSFYTGALFEYSCPVLMIKVSLRLDCRVLLPCGVLLSLCLQKIVANLAVSEA